MFFHKDDQKFATELSDPDQRVETLRRLRMARNLLFFGLIFQTVFVLLSLFRSRSDQIVIGCLVLCVFFAAGVISIDYRVKLLMLKNEFDKK